MYQVRKYLKVRLDLSASTREPGEHDKNASLLFALCKHHEHNKLWYAQICFFKIQHTYPHYLARAAKNILCCEVHIFLRLRIKTEIKKKKKL